MKIIIPSHANLLWALDTYVNALHRCKTFDEINDCKNSSVVPIQYHMICNVHQPFTEAMLQVLEREVNEVLFFMKFTSTIWTPMLKTITPSISAGWAVASSLHWQEKMTMRRVQNNHPADINRCVIDIFTQSIYATPGQQPNRITIPLYREQSVRDLLLG